VIDVGFVAMLGLAPVYGAMRWRPMSAPQQRRRDTATRDQYR
jgi:hypothetical protein